jgi:hypothetical protein
MADFGIVDFNVPIRGLSDGNIDIDRCEEHFAKNPRGFLVRKRERHGDAVAEFFIGKNSGIVESGLHRLRALQKRYFSGSGTERGKRHGEESFGHGQFDARPRRLPDGVQRDFPPDGLDDGMDDFLPEVSPSGQYGPSQHAAAEPFPVFVTGRLRFRSSEPANLPRDSRSQDQRVVGGIHDGFDRLAAEISLADFDHD